MVKWLLFLVLLVPSLLKSLPTVDVAVELPWNSIYEKTPFIATVSVTHDESQEVDLSSFSISGKKTEVRFIKNVRFAPNSPLVLSMYEVDFPGMDRGLQMLPAISVLVGGKKYSSIPSGFEVKGVNVPAPNQEVKGAYLKLETVLKLKQPLYPGQKGEIGYRYAYNTNVDLTDEVLPLLEAKGFKKLGEKQIQDTEEGGISYRYVTQRVEAIEPGAFAFPASMIAGYTYTDNMGKKQYIQPQLKSEIPAVTIQVNPFPEEGKPPSFQGAIGQFSMDVKLLTASPVRVGDKIQLQFTFAGTGDFEGLKPPDLCCQPGFSGFFTVSDLPPQTETKDNQKTFIVELSPQNSDIASIPPIQFSYFDPELGAYQTLISEGIPLKVVQDSLPTPKKEVELIQEEEALESSFLGNISTLLHRFPLSLSTVLALAMAWLVLFTHYKTEKEELKKETVSQKLWQEALAHKETEGFYPLAIKALKELHDPQAKDLLHQLEVERFNPGAKVDLEKIIEKGERLIYS